MHHLMRSMHRVGAAKDYGSFFLPSTASPPCFRPICHLPRKGYSLGVAGVKVSKAERTRQAIAEAALGLFEAHGYDATTVDQIVEAAAVSPRTFFRHFPRKELLLHSAASQFPDLIIRTIRDADAEVGPSQAVVDGIFRVAHEVDANRHLLMRWHTVSATCRSATEAERYSTIGAAVQSIGGILAERMGVDPEVDPRPNAIIGAGAACFVSSIRVWADGGGTDTLATHLQAALSAVGLPDQASVWPQSAI